MSGRAKELSAAQLGCLRDRSCWLPCVVVIVLEASTVASFVVAFMTLANVAQSCVIGLVVVPQLPECYKEIR